MRVIIYKLNGSGKIVKDYLTRKEATEAYYNFCDLKKCNYGSPVYSYNRDLNRSEQIGMESVGTEVKINLYFNNKTL